MSYQTFPPQCNGTKTIHLDQWWDELGEDIIAGIADSWRAVHKGTGIGLGVIVRDLDVGCICLICGSLGNLYRFLFVPCGLLAGFSSGTA